MYWRSFVCLDVKFFHKKIHIFWLCFLWYWWKAPCLKPHVTNTWFQDLGKAHLFIACDRKNIGRQCFYISVSPAQRWWPIIDIQCSSGQRIQSIIWGCGCWEQDSLGDRNCQRPMSEGNLPAKEAARNQWEWACTEPGEIQQNPEHF